MKQVIVLIMCLYAALSCCRVGLPEKEINRNNPAVDAELEKMPFYVKLTDVRPVVSGSDPKTFQGYYSRKKSCVMMNPDISVWKKGESADDIGAQIEYAETLPEVACGMEVEPVVLSEFGDGILLHTTAPVNISSSHSPADVVVMDDSRKMFRIRYGSGTGSTVISLWNGAASFDAASEDCRSSFVVHGNVDIPLEGVQIEWRGRVYDMVELTPSEKERIRTLKDQRIYIVSDYLHSDEDTCEEAVTFRIVGPVPYNAGPGWRLSDAGDSFCAAKGTREIYLWNLSDNPDFDWWQYSGALRPTGREMYPWEVANRQFKVFGCNGAEELTFKKYKRGNPGNYTWLKIMVIFGDKSYGEYFDF